MTTLDDTVIDAAFVERTQERAYDMSFKLAMGGLGGTCFGLIGAAIFGGFAYRGFEESRISEPYWWLGCGISAVILTLGQYAMHKADQIDSAMRRRIQ